jgi:hypothetical protein
MTKLERAMKRSVWDRSYYQRHRERILARKKRFYDANTEHCIAIVRKYKQSIKNESSTASPE